jgi:hypothetical protein
MLSAMLNTTHIPIPIGDEPVWIRHKTGKAKRAEHLTDGICRPGAKHPDGAGT